MLTKWPHPFLVKLDFAPPAAEFASDTPEYKTQIKPRATISYLIKMQLEKIEKSQRGRQEIL